MSVFWRGWFMVWCISIGIFGLVLSGGAFDATDGPVRLVLSNLQGPGEAQFDPTLRFSLAVLGAVSIGWAVTLSVVVRAGIALGARGRTFWDAVSAGLICWFVIDSSLSMATGFGLNVVPNIALAAMYIVGVVGSGALRRTGNPVVRT